MHSRRIALVLATILAAPIDMLYAAGGDRIDLEVTINGAPAKGVEVALEAANMGKVALGTTDANGNLNFALDAANLGKAQVRVVAEQCDAKSRVWLVGPGGNLPPEPKGCRRKVAGVFTWGKARLALDLARGLLTVPVTGGGLRDNHYFVPGVALVGAGVLLSSYGFFTHGLEEGCTEADVARAPSCKKSRNGIGVAGLALMGGGGTLFYVGRGQRTAIGLVPGGVSVRHTIRF